MVTKSAERFSLIFLPSWTPVLFGLAILFLPTYWDLSQTLWQENEYAHGPIVLAVVLWMMWQRRENLWIDDAPKNTLGGTALCVGLLMYWVGRSQDIMMFEVSAQIPLLFGAVLCCAGSRSARQLLFPCALLIFLVPLPGQVLDALTGPLKQLVSTLVEAILHRAGYPIGRSGVVLIVGPYQLLVDDACSGLKSMYSLIAVGVMYLYVRGNAGWIRNAVLIAMILPIAFIANIARVTALSLITYYLGERAGLNYMHDFAAISEFVIALVSLISIDQFLSLLTGREVKSWTEPNEAA